MLSPLPSDITEAARTVVQGLLRGDPPNGHTPAEFGPWAQVVGALYAAHTNGGTSDVRRIYDVLIRGDRKLARLVAGAPAPERPVLPDSCPALPAPAARIFEHLAPCGVWLDDYIDFATKAAPMTPRAFHEAAGLFAASVAIARRLVLRASTTAIYPNLFFLFIAPSTIKSKTTGLKVLSDMYRHARLEHLLLPQRMTPEAVVQELGTTIPSTLNNWDEQARASWLVERAFAAQRGWALDEASSLFDGLKRDFNAGLMALMLNLYECPERTTEQTVGRGRVTVHDAYLNFFGAATPAGLSEHITNHAFWTNGLWARFALISSDEDVPWVFFPPPMQFPAGLIAGLRHIYELFPVPSAALEERGESKEIVVHGAEPASMVLLGTGVWQAWEAYAKALRFDMLKAGVVEEGLFSSYGRMGTHAIKVAMVLAAMDTTERPVHVEPRHLARAVQITERWRASLHEMWRERSNTTEAQATDKVLRLLAEAGPAGLLPRDIYRPMNASVREINNLLEELEQAGQVERATSRAGNGRKLDRWTLVPEDRPAKENTIPEVS